ncbi:MAG: 50S ribosomal protein L17 [Microgenomates group bacterium]
MKHQQKKIKFNFGYDANRMLVKKLVVNFLNHGYLETTEKKAKVLKQVIERLVSKMKIKTNANKNYLLRYLSKTKLVDECFEVIGPALANVNGGYVRIVKKQERSGDGAKLAKIEWAYPVVKKEIVKKDGSKKNVKKVKDVKTNEKSK